MRRALDLLRTSRAPGRTAAAVRALVAFGLVMSALLLWTRLSWLKIIVLGTTVGVVAWYASPQRARTVVRGLLRRRAAGALHISCIPCKTLER